MKSPNTFRRNVVEEKIKDTKATTPINTTNEKLGKLNDSLNEINTQSSITSDAVESAGNKVVTSVQDVQAGVELVIDSLAPLQDISSSLKDSKELQLEINENISKLGALLQEKFTQKADPSLPTVIDQPKSETEKALTELLPMPVEDKPLSDAIKSMIVENKKTSPDSSISPEIEDKEKSKAKEKDLLDKISKSVVTGFKSTYEMTNRIASMLFKYSVAAAATAVKWAAILLAVVLSLDLIIIHLKHWGKMFDENYQMFEEKLGPLAPILGSLFKTVNEIKDFWKNGDWGGLAVAIIKGTASILYNLGEALNYAMGKLGAALLRAAGQDDWADKLEAVTVENYALRTGYMPNEDELKLLTNRRYEQEQGKVEKGDSVERTAIRSRMNAFGETPEQAVEWLKANNPRGVFGKTYNEDNLNKEIDAVNSVSKEDVGKAVETELRINQLKRQAEEHKRDPVILDDISAALQKISDDITNDDNIKTDTKLYDLSEVAASAAQEIYQMIPMPEPEPVGDKEESKRMETISTVPDIPTASNTNMQNNQQINNISNNKTISNFAPVTNYNAPGMYRAQEVS